MKRIMLTLAALILALFVSTTARAQAYPTLPGLHQFGPAHVISVTPAILLPNPSGAYTCWFFQIDGTSAGWSFALDYNWFVATYGNVSTAFVLDRWQDAIKSLENAYHSHRTVTIASGVATACGTTLVTGVQEN